MSVDTESVNGGIEFLKAGDLPDRVQGIVQTAIDGGRLDEGVVHFGIPVAPDLEYWGRSEWHFPENGGRADRANVVFGFYLSQVMEREIEISGVSPAEVADGQEPHSLLLASTVEVRHL